MNNKKIAKIEKQLENLANNDNNLIDVKVSLINLLADLSKYIILAQKYEKEELIKLYNNIVRSEHRFSSKLQEKFDYASLQEIYNIFSIDEEIELLTEKIVNSSDKEKSELIKNDLKSIIDYLSLKISVLIDKDPYEGNDNLLRKLSDELQIYYDLMTKKIENSFKDQSFWPDLKNYLDRNNINNIFEKLSKKSINNIRETNNIDEKGLNNQSTSKITENNVNNVVDNNFTENNVAPLIDINLENDKFTEVDNNDKDLSLVNNSEINNKNIEEKQLASDNFIPNEEIFTPLTNNLSEEINTQNPYIIEAPISENINQSQSQIIQNNDQDEISATKQNDKLARILEDLNKKKRQN